MSQSRNEAPLDIPCLEFITKGLRSIAEGVREPYEDSFFLDLRGSNATRDHVLHYTSKGYRVVGFHNVTKEQLALNDSWKEIAAYVNDVQGQASAIAKAKPIQEVVERVKAKSNG